MAFKSKYEFKCNCGERFEAERYEYVYSDDNPEVKLTVLSGEFNCVACPACAEVITLEDRFVYRDEKHGLWIWVCKESERHNRERLESELREGNCPIEPHYLYGGEHRRLLVFGRDELVELLLREDEDLRRDEDAFMKRNPAIKAISNRASEPGLLFFNGDKIKMVSVPLKLSRYYKDHILVGDDDGVWLAAYAQGLNIHNPFSSFLSDRQRVQWQDIRAERPIMKLVNEFEDFAESWAAYKGDSRGFRRSYPERWAFLKEIRNMVIPRRIVSYRA